MKEKEITRFWFQISGYMGELALYDNGFMSIDRHVMGNAGQKLYGSKEASTLLSTIIGTTEYIAYNLLEVVSSRMTTYMYLTKDPQTAMYQLTPTDDDDGYTVVHAHYDIVEFLWKNNNCVLERRPTHGPALIRLDSNQQVSSFRFIVGGYGIYPSSLYDSGIKRLADYYANEPEQYITALLMFRKWNSML